jgi:hypothetical protein
MGDGGKGDSPRPIADKKQYENNWDAIFGKNQKHKQQDMTELNGDGNRDRGRYGEDLTDGWEDEEELMDFHGIPTKKSIQRLREKFNGTSESDMWDHYCTAEASSMKIGKDEECSWCGMTEK